MSKTLTLRGAVDAPDTRVVLTSGGDETAPSLVVPRGSTMIKSLSVVAAHDGGADDGSAIWFIRLGGNAVKSGEQTIIFGASGNQSVQSGADAAPNIMSPFMLKNADIEVQEGDTISISAEYGGVDIGDGEVAVTIVFN